MKFSRVLKLAGIEGHKGSDTDLGWISADSRQVKPGTLFVAMPSDNSDTSRFLEPAHEAGAVAAIVNTDSAAGEADRLGLAYYLVEGSPAIFNEKIGAICRSFFNDPTSKMRVIAVTGTNGKTTTAWMLKDALSTLGRRAAYLGTLGFATPKGKVELNNTTPFPVELWQMLWQAEQEGAQDFVMEASSHALEQRRLAGVSFDLGVFTNLTQDHLDYHGTMQAYAEAKKLLFTEYAKESGKAFVGVMNGSDPITDEWLKDLAVKTLLYGKEGQFVLEPCSVSSDRMSLAFADGQTVDIGVGGLFNVSNCIAVAASLSALGYSQSEIASALGSLSPVPGRFEAVQNGLGIGVIVDYAHTPDALEKLLASALDLHPNRLIVVFGCGGDRDRTKRPKMAKVASAYADLIIVTSDNPRTEDPAQIIEEVQSGICPGAECLSIIDRREAIQTAVRQARMGDIVVIAGKGHEDYQIIGRTKYPMDDRQMAREAMEVMAH